MPKQKGGKMKAKEVKDFLNASYDKTPPNDLDGYILDKSLSTDTAKVYYNPQTNHAVVAHRGTQGVMDWGNNLAYAVGAYNLTSRYKKGKSVQDKAEKKYGKQNISTLGHSQGAVLARKLGTDTKEVINVNPAYTGERPARNEYNIRSSTDVVSGLYAPVAKTREMLFPKYSEKHDITIPSQSATDVLGEHSYDILDRLGEKEIGVGAGNKISSNNIMYKGGKRYSRLGYTGEDIDWIGGGVITTNNNNGAVGTPYVNRGTNPYGTRGGLRRGAGAGASVVAALADINKLPIDVFNNVMNLQNERLKTTQQNRLDEIDEEIINLLTPFISVEGESESEGEAEVSSSSEDSDSDSDSEVGTRGGLRGGVRPDEMEAFINRIEHLQLPATARQLIRLIRQNIDQGEDEDAEEIFNDFLQVIGSVGIQVGTPDTIVEEYQSPYESGSEESEATEVPEYKSDEEMEGGKKNPFKSVSKTFNKVGKAFQPLGNALTTGVEYANPMMWALKDKDTKDAMTTSGEVTHDYLLPAVVSAGKPIYDATAITASTMLTGNPVLGKAVADTLWNEMVAKKGYDPRQNQKSAELGELSSTFGQAVSKPYSVALGGYRLKAGMYNEVKGGGSAQSINEHVLRTSGQRLFLNGASESLDYLGVLDWENPIILTDEVIDVFNLVNELLSYTTATDPDGSIRDEIENKIIDIIEEITDNFEDRQKELEEIIQELPPEEAEVELTQVAEEAEAEEDEEDLPVAKPTAGSRRKKGGSGIGEKVGEKIYDYLFPPADDEAFYERTRNRNLRRAEREEVEALSRAREMRQRADEMERQARERRKQKEKSAREYGKFEIPKITDDIKEFGERQKMEKEDTMKDEWVMEGYGRKNIDFDKIKFGTFTRMFKEFKKENPRTRVKDLNQFADRIIKNKKKFSDKAFKKAMFYKNILKKT